MVVVLLFASEKDAAEALPLLPGFKADTSKTDVLWRLAQGRKDGEPHDTRTEVDEVKELIERFRTYDPKDHRGPIDGTPFSIDVGPMFHCDFGPALAAAERAKLQLTLLL